MNAEKLIKETVERIKTGTLTDFSPLISLFQYERKPMTLDGHFMFLPMFSLEYPKYLTLQCGRQVSKSYTLAETLILTTGMIESFSSLYIAPRYDQLKRFHNQVLAPMLKTSCITPLILDKSGSDAIEMKTFVNGNSLMLEHAFNSPDRTRGASGVSRVCCDESVRGDTKILIFRLTDCKDGVCSISDRPEIIPISEVKQGDIVLSFTEDGCIYSPVVRDASYHGRRAVFKVTTQSGRILRCTADHRLHTNLGSRRLSEVIEYGCNSGDGPRAGEVGWDQRVCSECDRGNDSRGCECSQATERAGELRTQVEPRIETERLSGVQSYYIVRARYPSSVYEAESRLRGLLGSIGNTLLKDVYIACMDDLSRGGCPEDDNSGVAETSNTSGRSRVVVRRRRKPDKRSEHRRNRYKRFYRARGNTAARLAAKYMGDHNKVTTRKTLEYRQVCHSARCTARGIHSAIRVSAGISPKINAVQAGAPQEILCGVRERVSPQEQCSLLLRGLQQDTQRKGEADRVNRLSGKESRPDSGETGEVPRRTSGRDSSEISRRVCGDDLRTAGAQSAVRKRVSTESQGSTQCETSGMACTQERGSGIRAEAKRRAAAVLSTEDGRPSAAREDASAGTQKQQETRKPRETDGASTTIPCRASGDRGGTARPSESREKRAPSQRPGISRTPECTSPPSCGASQSEESRGTDRSRTGKFVLDRIISIEYIGKEDVYDIEVVGTHNYILANGMCSYNCQDINPDFMPVFESTTDASKFGVIQSTGTPKTSDTLLTLQFNKSSQCHWAIKCPHCSKWNIADIDEQLIGMIGKTGLSCAFCGKILDPRTGGWLPKFPERQRFHAGYHIPQIILPMHCENETKWKVLKARQAEWDKTRFFNEIIGVEADESVKLLTVSDLERAQTSWDNSLDKAAQLAKEFTTVFVGVDWSGGGGGFSRTAVAVLGHRAGSRETCVLFLETLPHGLTPEEEADRVAEVYAKSHAQMLAHDYTGAGFVRESVLLGRHPYLREHIYPFAYVFRTGKQLVTYQESGSRKSANVDKTRSLLLTFNAIRSGLLRVPKFNPANPKEPILEMLNIVERPQEFSKATIKDVYILQRAAGRYDDAAHAINIAYIAQCDLTEDWPNFSMDPKYEMSEAALNELTGGSGEVAVS